ncbi:MAG TPA: hypothetical protein G4O02_14045 [Caldilineae bacterium]|nr:hypothetical protein [Caldilineae bacterium]
MGDWIPACACRFGALKYAYFDGAEWRIETVYDGSVRSATSLVFDHQGNPAISFYDMYFYGGPPTGRGLKYAHFGDSPLPPEATFQSNFATLDAWDYAWVATDGEFSSLAFDLQGYPAISFYDMYIRTDRIVRKGLKYAHFNGTSWDIEEIDKDCIMGNMCGDHRTSLDFDLEGRPGIVYVDSRKGCPGDVKYAHYNGATWDIETVASESGYASLVFDQEGAPIIGYLDRAVDHVKFVRKGVAPPIGNEPPAKPRNISPDDGATDVSRKPTLKASAFSDPDGDEHVASQWQFDVDPNFSRPVYDSGPDTTNLTEFNLPFGYVLACSERIYWRVRYRDSRGTWSDWSSPTSFVTVSCEREEEEREIEGPLPNLVVEDIWWEPECLLEGTQWLTLYAKVTNKGEGEIQAQAISLDFFLSNTGEFLWDKRVANPQYFGTGSAPVEQASLSLSKGQSVIVSKRARYTLSAAVEWQVGAFVDPLDQIREENEGDNTYAELLPLGADADGDDICDLMDNCPWVPNSDQKDEDGDGVGDACGPGIEICDNEEDDDGDGLIDCADFYCTAHPRCLVLWKPDLTVMEIRPSAEVMLPSEPMTFTVEVGNLGGGTPTGFWVSLWTTPTSDAQVVYVDPLAQGYGKSITVTLQPPPGADEVKIYAQVDYDIFNETSMIAESREDNNTLSRTMPVDLDGDGIEASQDNCPFEYNPGQEDKDEDGVGDACDKCPEMPYPFEFPYTESDMDHDGVGDLCDADADGDGVPDDEDNCWPWYNPSQADTDDDGKGDACDWEIDVDSDEDGVFDAQDNLPNCYNPDQSTVTKSKLEKLPHKTKSTEFEVKWGPEEGSVPIDYYDIEYRVGGGDWKVWLKHTTKTSATFKLGKDTYTYYFRSIGYSCAGPEAEKDYAPFSEQVYTRVDTTGTLTIMVNPWQYGGWEGGDQFSIKVRDPQGNEKWVQVLSAQYTFYQGRIWVPAEGKGPEPGPGKGFWRKGQIPSWVKKAGITVVDSPKKTWTWGYKYGDYLAITLTLSYGSFNPAQEAMEITVVDADGSGDTDEFVVVYMEYESDQGAKYKVNEKVWEATSEEEADGNKWWGGWYWGDAPFGIHFTHKENSFVWTEGVDAFVGRKVHNCGVPACKWSTEAQDIQNCMSEAASRCLLKALVNLIPGMAVFDVYQKLDCDVITPLGEGFSDLQKGDYKEGIGKVGSACYDALKAVVSAAGIFFPPSAALDLVSCLDDETKLGQTAVGEGAKFAFNVADLTKDLLSRVGSGITAIVGSPVEVHIYDERGRHVGPSPTGGVDTEIPGAYYGKLQDQTIIWVPNDGMAYEVLVFGTDEGSFSLTLLETDKSDEVKVIEYKDVPVSTEMVAKVSTRDEDMIMHVDTDGDGTADVERKPTSVSIEKVRRALREILSSPGPKDALYRRDLATSIGESIEWPKTVPDPKEVFDSVGRLQIKGYALGEKTAEMSMQLVVPPDADIIAIPLATAVNGDVNETDSEAGVVITISDEATGQTSTTYATNIMETMLDVPYLYAYADVSPFRGEKVSLTITLLHPDICAGSLCTHNVDLYIGPVQFQRMPDICTTEVDGSHVLYDYLNDPSPTEVEACPDPQAFRFIEASVNASQPFRKYGAGKDTYRLSVDLPEDFQLLDFKLHYGPRIERMVINGESIAPEVVYKSFPVRRATYNRVEPTARYSFANNNPEAVASFFRPGENTIEVVVTASKPWEERPFSLYVRFLAGSEVAAAGSEAPGREVSGAYVPYEGYPNLAVLHVGSDIFNPGTREIQPTTVGKLFYQYFPDRYDFLVVYPLFSHDRSDSSYYVRAQNRVKGIGLPEKDLSSWFGSAGRLLGMAVVMPGTKPSLVLHEIGHQWSAYARFCEDDGSHVESLYKLWQYAPNHWTPLLNEEYGVVGGGKWIDNGDGTFTRAPAPTERQYLPISLYMMGLIPAEEVKPLTVIELDQEPGWWQPGSMIKGHERTITIDQIICAEGERTPDVQSSQKAFNAAFVVLVLEGEEPEDLERVLRGIESVRRKVPEAFARATGYRAQFDTTLYSREEMPDIAPDSFGGRD